jgi:hypothetical protein
VQRIRASGADQCATAVDNNNGCGARLALCRNVKMNIAENEGTGHDRRGTVRANRVAAKPTKKDTSAAMAQHMSQAWDRLRRADVIVCRAPGAGRCAIRNLHRGTDCSPAGT